MFCARLPQAERTSTAFVTLDAQTRGSFDLPEFTRAKHAAPRERTAMLGVQVPLDGLHMRFGLCIVCPHVPTYVTDMCNGHTLTNVQY